MDGGWNFSSLPGKETVPVLEDESWGSAPALDLYSWMRQSLLARQRQAELVDPAGDRK